MPAVPMPMHGRAAAITAGPAPTTAVSARYVPVRRRPPQRVQELFLCPASGTTWNEVVATDPLLPHPWTAEPEIFNACFEGAFSNRTASVGARAGVQLLEETLDRAPHLSHKAINGS